MARDPVKWRPGAGTGGHDLADHLRLRILSGELPAGSRLPPQHRFAADLGVARSVLREALSALVQEGYLDTRRGRHGGSFVRSLDDPRRRPARSSGQLDEVREAFEYRVAVEGHAAHLAARRRQARDLEDLDAAVALRPDTTLPLHDFRRADARFHAGVAVAARNRYLQEAVRHARAEVFLRTDRLLFDQEMGRMLAEHAAVLGAIRDADPDRARDLMERHVLGSLAAWERIVAEP